MRLLRIWILVVTTSLLCGGMVVGAPAEQSISEDRDAVSAQSVILYSQPPSPAGGLLQSSLRDPDGSDTDMWVWDGFTLASTHDITEVQWRGGYDPARLGSGGPVNDFMVDIYASIAAGTQPDLSQPPLVHYEVGGNANETPAEVLGGVQTYDYHYVLPAPFQAAAGTKYWVQIEAYQSGAPDWGLSKASEGDGYYFRTDGYIYQLVAGDAAFALLGPSYGADLALSKVDALDPVTEGDDVTYTVTASNNGPDPAQNVVLTDNLPAGVTFGSAVPGQGTCGQVAGVVTCDLGDITASGSTSVIITVTTTAPGTLTNNASVTSDTVDPNEANNSASEDTTVNAAPVPEADLSITKSDSPDPVSVGAILTYTLQVANSGPDATTAVTVTDELPVGVTYGGASGAGWNCVHSAGKVTCTLPFLVAVTRAPSILITVTAPASSGIITNTATVSSQEVDPDESSNLARITTRVWFFHYVYLPLVQR